MKLLKLLFPKHCTYAADTALLLGRIVFSLTLASHGWMKLQNFDSMSSQFATVFGLSSEVSLALCIFAELACAIAVAVGFLTRPAALVLVFNMGVAFFMAHQGSIKEGELAFLYLIFYILIALSGAGRFSLDQFIARKLSCEGGCSCHCGTQDRHNA